MSILPFFVNNFPGQPITQLSFSNYNIKKTHWAAEMPQRLRASTALAEDLSLVPITLVRQTSVTTAPKDPMLRVPAVTCTHIYIPTHKHTIKSAINFKKERKLILCQTLWPWCSLSHCECDFGLWSYLVFIFQMTNHRSWLYIFIVKMWYFLHACIAKEFCKTFHLAQLGFNKFVFILSS